MKKVVRCVYLERMPFDCNGVHATGNWCVFDDGSTEYEYDDSDFEYSESCVFEEECYED